MDDQTAETEKIPAGRMLIPTLAVASFAVSMSAPMLRLFTVDFATTFQVSTGFAAQTGTVNNVAEVIFALIMGVLAVRFKHKSLLLLGILLVFVSALGSFFAPTLGVLLIFYAMEGGATVMVGIMGFTLIGDTLPLKNKAKAISYLIAVTSLASLIGIIVMGFIADVWGWRSVFAFLVLPVSVVGLLLAFFGLPSRPHEKSHAVGENIYLSSIKQVLLNKSAFSCLLVGMLASAGATGVFAVAFFREQFLMPFNFAVVIVLLASSMYIIASLVVGRFANTVGMKPLTIVCSVGSSILVVLIFFMPNLWAAVVADILHVWFAAAALTAFSCLALDQVPKSRGTMMSMRSVFMNIGGAIGAAVGGVMLVLFSYQVLGLALGAMGLVAAIMVFLFIKDPNRPY